MRHWLILNLDAQCTLPFQCYVYGVEAIVDFSFLFSLFCYPGYARRHRTVAVALGLDVENLMIGGSLRLDSAFSSTPRLFSYTVLISSF